MEIRFSRHAKRRAKLYGISQETITDLLSGLNLSAGVHDIIKIAPGFKYPLKIVVAADADAITVITSYPLKKGKGK